MMVFVAAWVIMVSVFSSILSNPTKADWVAVDIAPERIVAEAMAIRLAVSGLWKTVVAMSVDSAMDMSVSAVPVMVLKVSPAEIMFLVSSSLPSALRLAVYFVRAEFIPQSLKRMKV